MVDVWCLPRLFYVFWVTISLFHRLLRTLKNYHFTYLNSSFIFFNLSVSKWAKVAMASVKSLLNPGACGFIKAFLYVKSCDKQTYSEIHDSCNRNFDISKNMLVEIEEIRKRLSKLKKCIQKKLGKDSPAKKI